MARHGWRRGGLAACRLTWWTVTVLVGATGVAGGCVVLGPFAAVCLAGVGALLAAAAVPWGAARTPPRAGPGPVVAGVLGATGPLAVIGLVAELGAAALLLPLLLAGCWWPLRRRPAPGPHRAPLVRRARPGPPVPSIETVPADPLPAAAALPQLSTADLCQVWRVTYLRLQHCTWSGEREHLAVLRRACLDELERRDPQTFARWVATARAAGDPARHFPGEQRQS